MKKKNIIYFLIAIFSLLQVGCIEDEIDKNNSIFDEPGPQNEFDRWIYSELVVPYNIKIKYKFDFMDSDFDFNLTPADFKKASGFAQVIKYCWIECYDEVAGIHFTKGTSPKEIRLIGSQALDYAMGTTLLGAAEGGTSVVLYNINNIKDYSYSSIVEYMHIMHHEFSHILDQTKMLDPAYGMFSQKDYVGDEWVLYEENDQKRLECYRLGFISPYSTVNEEEDYAEVYSRYITMTEDAWEKQLELSGEAGGKKLKDKLEFIRSYLLDSWEIDIDELRESVLRRIEKAPSLEILTFSEYAY